MGGIFIKSTTEVISASRAAGITEVYLDDISFPKGRTIILQHLKPKTFRTNNVALEDGAEAELLSWIGRQQTLETLCIEKMTCHFLKNAIKTVFYSPFTLKLSHLYIQKQKVSAKCLAVVSQYMEYSQTIRLLTINEVQPSCGEHNLSFILMNAWRLQDVNLFGNFSVSVASSLVYALKNVNNCKTEYIEIDLRSRISFKFFLSMIQKQESWRMFRVKQGQLSQVKPEETQVIEKVLGFRLLLAN